jgi:hypothetical protein
MHIIPIFMALIISLSITAIIRNGVDMYEKAQKARATAVAAKNSDNTAVSDNNNTAPEEERERNVGVKIGATGVNVSEEPADDPAGDNDKVKETSLKKTAGTVSQGIFDLIWAPIVIFITSFISVITALIYFKTRQAGGESMQDLLEQFEDAEGPRSKWQERVRERLVQSGRTSGSRSGSRSPSKS